MVEITPTDITMTLIDYGPGIPSISLVTQEGYSTASEEVCNLSLAVEMGLPNMRIYTDFMKITSILGKDTTVHMRMDIV